MKMKKLMPNGVMLENGIVLSYDDHYAALDDFKVRKEQFMKEFVALKEKFGVNVIIDQYVDSDYGTVDTDIIIRDAKYGDGNIEDYVEVGTMFDE